MYWVRKICLAVFSFFKIFFKKKDVGKSDNFITATVCGHKTSKKFTVEAFGEVVDYEWSSKECVEYCSECLVGMVILCARCFRPIFPTQRVHPFLIRDEDIPLIHKNQVRKHGESYVCCVSMDCAGGGIAGGSGRWDLPGVYNKVTIAE